MAKTTTSLEKVMVVPRSKLFAFKTWQGIKTDDFDKYLAIINKNHSFLPRAKVEDDPAWQQIIPYLVFVNQDKIFLMKRTDKGSDKRLHHKYSIGIGGHIRKSDLGSENIFDWAKREFEEEVDYQGNFEVEILGLLNRQGEPVDEVHFGIVFRLLGDSDKIKIKEDKHALSRLATLGECFSHYQEMEGWSQIVLDFLKKEKNGA